ncbi:hypothetical protein C8R42DRAFT_648590 [Lentinula raphanica]|nr:hypothetical protein C8R42DRAFT_648590 [Lentinula raphanica]
MSSDWGERSRLAKRRINASLVLKLINDNVGWIWATDVVHTVLVCTSVWQYLILCYLPKYHSEFRLTVSTVAITIATTAVVTLNVNSFYAWRIHKSKVLYTNVYLPSKDAGG